MPYVLGLMGLIEDLKEHFPIDVRVRAAEYAQRGRVIDLTLGVRGACAIVMGSEPYLVNLLAVGKDVPGDCSCLAFDNWGPCKHLWAVVSAVARSSGCSWKDAAGSAGIDSGPDWMATLSELSGLAEACSPDAWGRVPGKEVEFRYQLLRERPGYRGALTIRLARRRVLASGKWGKSTLLNFDTLDADGVPDPVDREILSTMGFLDSRTGYSGGVWHEYSRDHDLGPLQAARVLPMMARSGRLDLVERNVEPTPLRWAADGPLQLRLTRVFDQDTGEIVVRAVLEGDDRQVFESDVDWALPCGLVLIGEELAQVAPAHMTPVLERFVQQGALRLPADAGEEVLASVAGLPPEILSPELLSDLTPHATDGTELVAAVPHLHIAPTDGRVSGARHVECEVTFDYGSEEPVSVDTRERFVRHAETGQLRRRDIEDEGRRLAEFVDLGGQRPKPDRYRNTAPTVVARHIPVLVSALLGCGWRVTAEGIQLRSSSSFSISVTSGIDWFDLEGGLQFDDQVAGLPELLRAYRAGENRVELGDGTFGMLPDDWLARWDMLELGEATEDGSVRFQRNQGWLLDALLAERDEVALDTGFDEFREQLARFRGIRSRKEPRGFQGELRAYQREGLGWFRFLQDLGLGGCLADDMGLGKTVQVLAMLEAWRTRRRKPGEEKRPSLVVAPRSLIFNWIDEAARFAPRLTTLDYTGTGRKSRWAEAGHVDLVLTTYGTLRRDALELSEIEFDHVILDEATAIKNANSQAAKAARLLRARHRLALSGTPVENHLGDLWSLFEFLNPGMLGRSRTFQALMGGDADEDSIARLAKAIEPFFLRRTKAEVLTDLPPKSEQVILCELSRKERRRYDELKEHYRASLLDNAPGETFGRQKIQVLEALLRLRQAACHPGLLDAKLEGDDSAKLDLLMERLAELAEEGHKVLVFSQFTRLLGIVRKRLDAQGIVYEYLDGKTRKRKEKVERFQSDADCPVFLISLKAGGHGLNLTASDYVFLLDPWWNPAVEAQAVDRAHRIGQEKPVFAYRLIAKDTVEEHVIELQKSKRELADALFGGGGGGVLKSMTRGDLEMLLS